MKKKLLNLVGFLLLNLENLRSVCAGENERSFTGAIIVREGSFFTHTPLLSKRASKDFACTHICLANTLCITIVFCDHGSRKSGDCHLFNKGIRTEQTVGNYPFFVEKNGCTFYQFVDVFEGCSNIKCQNGGSCYHDNEYGGFKCACVGDHEGDFCERLKPIVYRFTHLRSSGRTGPTSKSQYTGTTLEGSVTLLQGKQQWSVPFTGRYHFDIQGASGGDGRNNWHKGGKGAKVSGFVSLIKTASLIIVVGQEGVSSNTGGGGGGGGSFVFYSDNRPIGVAGGGGGGGGLFTQKDGQGGLASQTGGLYGGRKGLGGTSCTQPGYAIPGGGGGYVSNGLCFKGPTCLNTTQCDAGGGSSKNGFLGGRGDSEGGFGGGGAANSTSPGGGGGYSGGGVSAIPQQGFAGGGGSFTFDSSWNAVSDYNDGHGSVTVTFHG